MSNMVRRGVIGGPSDARNESASAAGCGCDGVLLLQAQSAPEKPRPPKLPLASGMLNSRLLRLDAARIAAAFAASAIVGAAPPPPRHATNHLKAWGNTSALGDVVLCLVVSPP